MKKRTVILTTICLLTALMLAGCGKKYQCDVCGDTFSGTAYYDGFDAISTLCKECAIEWFAPLSIEGYKK